MVVFMDEAGAGPARSRDRVPVTVRRGPCRSWIRYAVVSPRVNCCSLTQLGGAYCGMLTFAGWLP